MCRAARQCTRDERRTRNGRNRILDVTRLLPRKPLDVALSLRVVLPARARVSTASGVSPRDLLSAGQEVSEPAIAMWSVQCMPK